MKNLYSQVCEDILGQIRAGELRVGERLPPEAEYAATLGISRSTLRMAFAELEEAGVLKRRKRAGTEIISDRPQRRFSMATSGVAELLSLGRDTEFSITSTRQVPTEEIPQLAGLSSETGHWLEVSGSRRMQGESRAFSVNRVYVPARFAAIEPVLHEGRRSVFQTIEETFDVRIGRVAQSVRAVACPDEDAKVIGLEPGAPALRIEAQLYLSDERLMEVSVATFHPERFQVHNDVKIK
ncbi:GntR family transcriptional regulator [Roseivivax sp.]